MKTNPYPRTHRNGKVTFKHRDMAELAMGRQLQADEVVHHDEGKTDFHPENLKVFSSQSAHTRYHHYLRRQAEGVGHLFELDEWLALYGEAVVWSGSDNLKD